MLRIHRFQIAACNMITSDTKEHRSKTPSPMAFILFILFWALALLITAKCRVYIHDPTSRLYIGERGVHAKGVFAAQKITANTFVITAFERNKKIGGRSTKLMKFVNHSLKPTLKLRKDENTGDYHLYSTRKIDKDEEATIDYNDAPSFIKRPTVV